MVALDWAEVVCLVVYFVLALWWWTDPDESPRWAKVVVSLMLAVVAIIGALAVAVVAQGGF